MYFEVDLTNMLKVNSNNRVYTKENMEVALKKFKERRVDNKISFVTSRRPTMENIPPYKRNFKAFDMEFKTIECQSILGLIKEFNTEITEEKFLLKMDIEPIGINPLLDLLPKAKFKPRFVVDGVNNLHLITFDAVFGGD